MRGVKVLTQAFDAIRHIGHGEGGLNSLVASTAVVVKVNEGSCLLTEVVIGSELSQGILNWLERNGENLVIKGSDVSLMDRAEAETDGIIAVRGFIWLWGVE
jgi:hypothetical protein